MKQAGNPSPKSPSRGRQMYEYQRTNDGQFMCPHCNVVKKLQSTMHMHYKANHDGALKHKCKDCNYETATKQALDKHIAAKHPAGTKSKDFQCTDCNFACSAKAGLRSHYLLKHLTKEVNEYLGKNNDDEICCTRCGSDFASKPAYVYHLAGCLPAEITQHENVKKCLGI
jgi:hypothetical protein